MAAAVPFVPMMVGAGVGALVDKGNPLRGAMLGAVGGGVAGPAFSAMSTGLTGPAAGIMSGAQAAGVPMGIQEASMMGAQLGSDFGGAGVAHALGSAGVDPMLAKGLGFATMGPQGALQGMGAKEMLNTGRQGLGIINAMSGGQQQQAPISAPPMAQSPSPQMAQMRHFGAGPVIGNKRQNRVIRGILG